MWKESQGSKVGRKGDHNRAVIKDGPPHSRAQQQQPKTHWLGPSLVKKQKEFRKIFEFPEDEEIVASARPLIIPPPLPPHLELHAHAPFDPVHLRTRMQASTAR
jgi:hypothetical protein